MSYLSLYRKYRPQTFAEVVGQDHVTVTLAAAVTEDRLHHAYLFTGPRGTGKTSTARILAKALNCETGPTDTPCNTCVQCESITSGSSMDVIEIDAASHGGVDDVRDLRERVAFAPAGARMKVYIVDECHMLSTAGWNAFLKTVEEPPGHVVFVFATTEPHKVLDTILSRTQRFDFKRVGADVLAAHVSDIGGREGLVFDTGAVELIVRAGDGSVRDTLSVLDQIVAYAGTTVTVEAVADVLGTVPEQLLLDAAEGIAAGDVPRLCRLVQELADRGIDLRQFARDAVEHLRALFLLQASPEAPLVDGTPERLARLRAQAARLGQVELLRAVELLADAQAQMRRGNTRLPLEIALVKAALPDACGDPAALAARLDRLERRVGMAAPQTEAPDHADVAQPAQAATEPAQAAATEPAQAATEPAQPVTAQAAQVQTPRAAVDAVTFDLVRVSWPAVLDAAKTRSRKLHAWLMDAQPQGLDGSVLSLQFRHAFHAENCAADAAQAAFGAVFEEVLGARLRLRCLVQAEEEHFEAVDGELESVLEAEASDAPDDAIAHDRALQRLQRNLGATVIDEGA